MIKNIVKQFQVAARLFTELGIVNEINPPAQISKGNISEITMRNAQFSLNQKEIPYRRLYQYLRQDRQYHFCMIDGALLLLLYRFKRNVLLSHRLSFFPYVQSVSFADEPDAYLEDNEYVRFADIRTMPCVLRFDYDVAAFEPVKHPKSHLTLGQYEFCRIPVSAPMMPNQFFKLIIDCFYNNADHPCDSSKLKNDCLFAESLAETERRGIFLSVPSLKS